jgi:hypothetical protein
MFGLKETTYLQSLTDSRNALVCNLTVSGIRKIRNLIQLKLTYDWLSSPEHSGLQSVQQNMFLQFLLLSYEESLVFGSLSYCAAELA